MLFNESMKLHTTFRIGGNADFLFIPDSVEEIVSMVKICKQLKLPLTVIGNGSNLIVSDNGIRGVTMKIAGRLNKVLFKGNQVIAQAGVLIDDLIHLCGQRGLGGIECLTGIPGALGGTIYMNGGYTGSIDQFVEQVTVINYNGEIKKFSKKESNFDYRTSYFHCDEYIIIEAILNLETVDVKVLNNKIKKLKEKRRATQPIDYPSCGSVFKKVNLKQFAGRQIGGAQVSEMCPAFIINVDNASSEDVLQLIKSIKVDTGKQLPLEAKIIGGEV